MGENNTKPATTAVPTKHTSIRPSVRLYPRMIQSFFVVWLDGNIDENNDDYQNTITKLREISNTVNTFTNVDECVSFITNIKVKKVIIITSGTLGQTTVPIVHGMAQVNTIYIFCGNKTRHERWAQQWPKVKGVFTDIEPICEALKEGVQECDQNTISMSFLATNDDATNRNLDQLDQLFMYTQILKEILSTIGFEEEHFMEFITYCREQFDSNPTELKNVNELEEEYHRHTPIWWYTHHCFLFSMLNCALRTMEVDLIIKLGFFIRNLHEHITRLHSEQYAGLRQSDSFIVYRAQGLSQTDFDQLMKTKGGLLSFNSFLSTSKIRQVSMNFAREIMESSDLVGILFVMAIDPSNQSTPFTDIHDIGYYPEEEEILFSMHSIFRIRQIKKIDGNNRLWQVDLTLAGDKDPQLHALTEYIREETFPHAKGWYRLGKLLIKLGQFDKAKQVYDVLLAQTADDHEKVSIYHQIGRIKDDQGEYGEAVAFYEKSIEIQQKTLPPNHPDLAPSYGIIGLVYDRMGEYSKALSFHEKALEIYQKTLPSKHPSLTTSYSNIGAVYDKMGEYSKALSFHENALEIHQKTLPPNHPLFATSYNNIGRVYNNMGEYSKAFSFHEKALEIYQKTLPPNCLSLAASYNNIGRVYNNMGEYAKALSFHEKALEIEQKTFPPNHPLFGTSHSNIGLVYDKMGKYAKALSFHEKALDIKQKTLPSNHPLLATSHSNIGLVYDKMGEYSKALSFHEKALEIYQKTLPPNHPSLATSYINIGRVYNNMGEYSRALSFHEKALEIDQRTPPPNYLSLAASYSNIGRVYDKMDEYSKALSYFEKTLEILKEIFHTNHPSLATTYNNIGKVHYHMREHSKALSFYEKTLQISESCLPPDHPDLGWFYNDIGMAYDKMCDYSKAFSFYERALNIGQGSLPENHPHLQLYKDNLESIKKK